MIRPAPPRSSAAVTGRCPGWVVNLATLLASVGVFLLFCELVVFRFIWIASDAPANAYSSGLIRYAPDQQGVWRVRDEIAAPYAINGQGWNSGVGDYQVERRPGTARIALVGDSYVEALQVPFGHSIGERLAAALATETRPVEVYRFAISGAPMSQYLAMVEREAVRYRPDWIVVLIVHNDFDESYRFVPGRYTSSFLKLRVADGRVSGEIPSEPWSPNYRDWLRRTATARFFLYRWQVRPGFVIRRLLPEARAAPRVAANIDVATALADMASNAAVTDYVFGRLDAVTRAAGARLLLAMDGDRSAIYSGTASPVVALNRLAERSAAAHGLPFVDLDPVFAGDWLAEHRRFDFAADNHWNEHGHEIAARAIAGGLRAAGWR